MAYQEDNVIIIPALDPNEKLIQIVNNLKKVNLNKIIVIDDGSANQEIFNKLSVDKINVIHHVKNLGKGAAIKTGVKNANKFYNHLFGYIFIDSDGQHTIEDIVHINNELLKENEIILGVRNFKSKNVPIRSLIGNTFSSLFFKLTTGKKLMDTQTGLRGIPIRYQPILLSTTGDRYEYEMNFLTSIAKENITFKTIPIKTIYEDNNRSTHFNTIKDSYLIYKEPIKFTISSLTSFFLDISLFILFNKISSLVFCANVLSRLLSGIYNYNMNKYWCFKTYGHHEFIKYFILFIIQMFLSSTLVKLFSLLNINLTFIKIVVDFSLFIMSYIIQKNIVFKRKAL